MASRVSVVKFVLEEYAMPNPKDSSKTASHRNFGCVIGVCVSKVSLCVVSASGFSSRQ
jgi:hypothetical protein